jgi:membrane-associated phospholipid phosphatase
MPMETLERPPSPAPAVEPAAARADRDARDGETRAATDAATEGRAAPQREAMQAALRKRAGYLPADLITFAYLAVTGLLILVSPLSSPAKGYFAIIHFGLLALTAALRFVPRDGHALLRFLRYSYPLAGLPFFYAEVAHLSRLVTTRYFDPAIVALEQAVFGCQPSQMLHTWLPWMPLREFLHLCYGVYILLMPLGVLTLFFLHRMEDLKRFTTSIIGTFFACYLIFVFFPVQGPFHYFGPIHPASPMALLPRFTNALIGHGSSLGTAFPSSHVAVAVALWMAMPRDVRWLKTLYLIVAIGIFFGTVYGGYHYAVDATTGLILGIALGLVWPHFHRWASRRLGVA